MKHLKGYKIFEQETKLFETHWLSIVDDLEDICQDAKDDNINVYINFNNKNRETAFRPFIMFKKVNGTTSEFPMSDSDYKGNKQYAHPILISEIKDTIDRIKLYIKESGYEITSIQGFDLKSFHWVEKDIDKLKPDECYAIVLYFNRLDTYNESSKSHIELDNDEIVEYVRSILLELDDLDTITNEIIFFNRNGNSVYFATNNIGTYEDGKSGPGNNKDLPIDRVDLLINVKSRNNLFDYSDVNDVVNHINSYLWERGFGQDFRGPNCITSHYKSTDMSTIHNCLLIDFDGVRNLERLCVSFSKKL